MKVNAEIVGSVWRLLSCSGEHVEAGQTLAVIESMKMEIPVLAPCAGKVSAVFVEQGQIVQEGEPILQLVPES